MKKVLTAALVMMALVAFPSQVLAGAHEKNIARQIGNLLITQFQPESIKVTISNGGSFAWVEATGMKIEKIRIENMKLRALLKDIPQKVGSNDKYDLASLIMSSKGEMVLAEKDVNNYFRSNNNSGFSKLKFNFTPQGFSAQGLFSTTVVFNLHIRLKATGVLGLENDGIYLEDTSIYVEGLKQNDDLVDFIIGRVNPLLPFKKIPFPVEFKKIYMTNNAAVVTSDPQPIGNGESWSWHK
jgi:hypothetical protein